MTSFFWYGSCGSCGNGLTQKLNDPRMTTAGNPLAGDPQQHAMERLQDRNMQMLRRDAEERSGRNGHIYSAIMSTRYNKED